MNSDCQFVRDRIADLVAGLLPASEIQGLQGHLDSCEDCRGYLQTLQEEETVLTDYFARLDSQNAGRQQRVLQALANSHIDKRTTIISIWRTIMTNRYSRLGAVAAVLAIVAASIVILDKSTTSAYAITDVSAAFDQARVIHIKGLQYFPGQTLDNGEPIPPVPIDTWIDLENGRTRQVAVSMSQQSQMSSSGKSTTHTTVTVTETVCNGPYTMTLDRAAQTATFSRVSDFQRRLRAYQQSRQLWGQLSGQAAQLDDFTKVGQEDIEGRPHDVWQLDATHTFGGRSGLGGGGGGGGLGMVWSSSGGSSQSMTMPSISTRAKLWLAADGGRLDRAQNWSRTGDGDWQLQRDYQTIEYNVQAPATTFAVEPPEGYAATNSKETAPESPLRTASAGCGANGKSLECGVSLNFTLADGSVVVGWQSFDTQSPESEAPLFESLAFGGPLPKLPIEIYALEPAGTSAGLTYTGYHLAYTRKADRFTEWTLYVPAGTPPAGIQQSGYSVLYRFNLDPVPNAGIGLTMGYGVPIRTTEDFNSWVRGGMAELSDDATAPADVTYQRVVDLARQIRNSAKP